MIKFIKGMIMGTVFAVPAVFALDSGHNGICGLLLLGAIMGGIAVDLEYV